MMLKSSSTEVRTQGPAHALNPLAFLAFWHFWECPHYFNYDASYIHEYTH